jgi:hypothetical protein
VQPRTTWELAKALPKVVHLAIIARCAPWRAGPRTREAQRLMRLRMLRKKSCCNPLPVFRAT